mgnify:CR=1 FL=1
MILFENARLWDGFAEESRTGVSVLVEGETIREVSDRPIAATATRLDLGGRTLMPGLIDAHVHVVASLANIGANAMLPDAVVAMRAGKLMREMLMRGFTTVRDLGGATLGLRMAWEEGLIEGSRLNMCGKALSQTGGHCDFRTRADTRGFGFFEARLGSLGRLVDGVDEVRRAAREEGILVGISSGATLAAIAQKLPELPAGATVLGFNYDTGERYLSVEGFLPAA